MPKSNPEHQLHVIVDAEGRKIVEKLFDRYVRGDRDDFSRHPEFMIAIDRLVSEFGGVPAQREDEDGEPVSDDEDDYDQDEDLHGVENEEQAALQRAITNIVRRR